ncbi:MAG TPA: hypothetical protein DCZ92_04105 [Elusimicrobia bacterium]|nr:MAG: hypothetical protein A2016_10240 [Elusimicrobia bacterium GWF2_62_30]HBA60000.1 hypothetical protein [Elusimicrobiota bacterium]
MLHFFTALTLAACLSVLFLRMVREDNATGKIRNRLVLRGLAFVAAAYLLLGLQTLAGILPPALPAAFFGRYLQHGLITFVAAFMLWKSGTWPAGDAKLFILAALAIPLLIPGAAYFPNTLFIALLINILVPAAVVFIFQAAASACRGALRADRAGVFQAVRCAAAKGAELAAAKLKEPGKAAAFLLLTALFGVARFLRDEYSAVFHMDELLFFALMMVVWPLLSGLLKIGGRAALGGAALCAGFCSFSPFGRELLTHAGYGITRSIPFLVFYKALEGLMGRDTRVTITPGEISQGTVLSGTYLKKLEKAAPDFYSAHFREKYPDGLTGQQAEDLKAFILRPDTPAPELAAVGAHTARPFAAWIAVGALLTLALHGETVINLCKYATRRLNG